MALNLQIQSLTYPINTEFPGTMQELSDLLAQYFAISGQDSFSGINYGNVEPTAENRDKPWFKLDDNDNPIGWFSWSGVAWVSIPVIIPNGATASRPASPILGQVYFDTDIKVGLIFNGAKWVTQAGSPGDIKYVGAPTIDLALAVNPGWSSYSDGIGVVIGGASSGSGGDYDYNSTHGSATATLVAANLPSDGVKLPSGVGNFPGQFQNGTQSAGVYPITTGLGAGNTISTQSLNGGVTQVPIDTLSPTRYLWVLQRDLT